MDSKNQLLTTADISSLKKKVKSGELKIDEIKKIYSMTECELLEIFQEELNAPKKSRLEDFAIK